MSNRVYLIVLEETLQSLTLSRKTLETDIKQIAERCEDSLEKAHVNDRDTAMCLLSDCIKCYLNGRGVRFDKPSLQKKNKTVLVSLVTLISLYAWKKSSQYYPRICELIPPYPVRNTSEKLDIVAEAEKILREKSRHSDSD